MKRQILRPDGTVLDTIEVYEVAPGVESMFPPGSRGYEQEADFMQQVERLRDVGYGRMRQMIQGYWDAVERERMNGK